MLWSEGLLSKQAAAAGATILLTFVIGLIIQRLYLSPVAKFPGPKLAAATFWYEFYYDVVKRGQYTWRIREMHQKYGIFKCCLCYPDSYSVAKKCNRSDCAH